MLLDTLARIAFGVAGIIVVIYTLASAIRSFVLPRAAPDALTKIVFRATRRIFNVWAKPARSYEARDRAMAMYAPVTLVLLPGVWIVLIMLGYSAIFWLAGVTPYSEAVRTSIASASTLGFTTDPSVFHNLIMFSESLIGLVLVALLISYLPAIYSAFSRREALVTMLEVRAGSPPSVVEMLSRYHRLGRMQILSNMWLDWEAWFAELEESHTSLAVLAFFRSPRPHRSWVTAAGVVLDTASFVVSAVDIPHDVQANICIRAGFIALRHIGDFFRIPYDPKPKQGDPISITREEFDDVCLQLETIGVPLKKDREQAWLDFSGWRVNYDTVLLSLAALTMAPYAPWISDRSPIHARRWDKRHRRMINPVDPANLFSFAPVVEQESENS